MTAGQDDARSRARNVWALIREADENWEQVQREARETEEAACRTQEQSDGEPAG